MTYKVINATRLAEEYGLEVTTETRGLDIEQVVTAEVIGQALDRAVSDGWTLQHVLGLPRDPALFLYREREPSKREPFNLDDVPESEDRT